MGSKTITLLLTNQIAETINSETKLIITTPRIQKNISISFRIEKIGLQIENISFQMVKITI